MVGRFLFAHPSLGTFLVTLGCTKSHSPARRQRAKVKNIFDYCIIAFIEGDNQNTTTVVN